jgi:hypothetical protein
MALLFRLVHYGLRWRHDDFHSGYQERNVSRLSHRSKAKVNAKESDQRGMKRDSAKGHMRSRMKPVTVRDLEITGHFQSISMLFPVKDLGATFSRNSNADETPEPVKEVCDSHCMQRMARVLGMPASGRSPTS